MHALTLSRLPAARLLTPRRLDLALKWRFFRHLLGGDDPAAERLYRWHIERRTGGRERHKRSVDDYVVAARVLLAAMQDRGFDRRFPVPRDPAGELLDGAHRVSSALALRCDIWIVHLATPAWAPAWDAAWFRAAGMDEAGIDRLNADHERLCRSR